jgi:class 3 adenylate cyclase/CHASE2 domain-containing sensor protein
MTRNERRLLVQTLLVGVMLTLAVLFMSRTGLLSPMEHWLYDLRAQRAQFFNKPPSDRIVQLDIDDPSLETIGRWPWPRDTLATLLDELTRAGVKAVAFDIVLPEAQATEGVKQPDGTWKEVNHDVALAEAVRRNGKVLLPIAFATPKPEEQTRLYVAARAAFGKDLELDDADVLADRLRQQGVLGPNQGVDKDTFIKTRRAAAFDRLFAELRVSNKISFDELRAKLLPNTSANMNTSAVRVLSSQYPRALSMALLSKFGRKARGDLPPMLRVNSDNPPTPTLAAATAATGFVDYVPDEDGVVRNVPLWADFGDVLYPQMGLALACMYLDVPVQNVELHRNRVVIPRPNGEAIVIPTYTARSNDLQEDVGFRMPVPWFGRTEDWVTMYDPKHEASAQHLPMTRVWDVHEVEERIRDNCAAADQAVLGVMHLLADPDSFAAMAKAPRPPLDDADARLSRIAGAIKQVNDSQMLPVIEAMTPADVEEAVASIADPLEREAERRKYKVFAPSAKVLPRLAKELSKLQTQLARQRAELRAQLAGRAAIIGWAAQAKVDFKPTSLHSQCPGTAIHGVIFSGILSGDLWRVAPPWWAILFTLVTGFTATIATALLSPLRALAAAVALALTYAMINGIVLFDAYNLIVGAAGPLTAVALVWPGCTMYRFVIERRERERITRRFRSYVDPSLVNYVIEHADSARLNGETREMSVVFTDLAGFTTISEKLQENTVPLLNEYMGLMVPVIRDHHGLLNKFLGDGIMFFFGAPRENPRHARDAVDCVLAMQRELPAFNARLKERGLPEVAMRCGVNTGPMIVGDAGSIDAPRSEDVASDYTVLGDSVNTSARFESANKATGTWIMIGQRTAELVGDGYVLRPIGKLQVVGKTQGVMTFEPLAPKGEATEKQIELAQRCTAIVERFTAGDFRGCLEAIAQYEQAFEPGKLSKLYRKLCDQYLANPPSNGFDGSIVLESK